MVPVPVIDNTGDHTYSVWYKLGVSNILAGDRYFIMESTFNSTPSSDPAWSVSYGLRDVSGDGKGDLLHVTSLDLILSYDDSKTFYYDLDTATETEWHNMTVTAQNNSGTVTHIIPAS